MLNTPYDFTTDQRGSGFARLFGSHVDIGAFELNGADLRLPVELASFDLSQAGRSVVVSWRTASEVNNAGFEVYRAAGSDTSFQLIGSWLNHPELVGLGTSSYGRSYGLADDEVLPGKEYQYRLVDVANDGIRTEHPAGSIMVSDEAVVTSGRFSFDASSPNPVKDAMTIHFEVPGLDVVTVEVYTVDARLVSRPVESHTYEMGGHTAVVSVRDLSPGVYLVRIKGVKESRSRWIVVAR